MFDGCELRVSLYDIMIVNRVVGVRVIVVFGIWGGILRGLSRGWWKGLLIDVEMVRVFLVDKR